MKKSDVVFPSWLAAWMKAKNILLWGAADLRDLVTQPDDSGYSYPYALSFAIPMNPQIMVNVQNGPNEEYAEEYRRVNSCIQETSQNLAADIRNRGFQARSLAASERTDAVNMKGDFPHKTAATRAGLGWIGSNCQLVTPVFGPWVRLGTVFTDMNLPCGPPVERHLCGLCDRCVKACPASALKKTAWYPGLPREELLDAHACDQWKKDRYFQFNQGRNCGICSAVCPYGLKLLKRSPGSKKE